MEKHQIAAQLYTVRDHCQNIHELAATARRLRKIGYPAVQLSGVGPIADDEIVSIMSGEGLTICATHESPAELLDNPEKCVERLHRLGCTLTAFPWPGQVDFGNFNEVTNLARRLDRTGDILRRAGIRFAYHNHAMEMVRLGEVSALEYIFTSTGSDRVLAEIDTYWVYHGGGNVVEWCKRMQNRLPLMHLKDARILGDGGTTWCEVGSGILNWPEIIQAGDNAGCEWFIVEQDTCPGDPFDSLQKSLAFILNRLIA